MALTPGTRLGVYEITALLGEGGMGQVYRATDTKLKRQVAVKILPPVVAADAERLARFQREAEVLASLNHPNIAAIYGLEESGGMTALIMELVEGDDLSQRIARGAIPIDETLPIAKQIAEALEAAHEQGIIHRDLKPANIKVRSDGTVKVLDFGLAKAMEPVGAMAASNSMSPTITSPAMMTGVGMILGTAAYMSPEQARGKPVDKRTDVWAFGCVLYEMLTGTRPFDGEDVTEVLGAVVRLEPNWEALPSDLPPLVRTMLQSCLSKDRRKRVADLSTALFVLDNGASLTPAASARTRPATRHWLPYVATIGATVVVAASAFTAMRREATTPAPVRRFSLDLAGNTVFTGTGRHVVAVSPDGSTVAFAAGNRIYVRPMDSLQAKALEGTELGSRYGRSPFFSPDGRWIGFWQAGELKKVSVTGGAIVTIARDVDTPFGATWLDDDTILFGAGSAGIWRVAATGGIPKQIITVKDGQLAHGPQLLPDHDHVLFTLASGTDWNEAQIVAQSLATGARTVLIPQGTDGRYVEGGYLLYGLRGTVFGAPVDVANIRLNAAPVPVLQNVSQAPFQTGAVQFGVSRNGTLAYAADAELVLNRLTWIDRTGRSKLLVPTPVPFYAPRLSRDGKNVAVARRDDSEGDSIWTMDAERGTENRLTPAGVDRRYPVWSDDGRSIAYGSQREQRVFRQAADGAGKPEEIPAKVAATTSGLRPLRFDLAGGSLFVQNVGGSTRGISRVSLDSADGTRAVQGADGYVNAELSADGRWIAYEANESGRSQVYVRPFPNVDGGRWQVSAGGGTQPVWSKSGRELFYIEQAQSEEGSLSGRLVAVPVFEGPEFRTGPPLFLFQTDIGSYDVGPDGQRFLFSTPFRRSSDATARILIVENWFEELKRLVPTK